MTSETPSNERAEALEGQGHGQDNHPFKVTVIYNGQPKAIEAKPEELTQELLKKAINEFHVTNNPHLLSLFRDDNTRVEDGQTLRQAGITSNTVLQLRPDAVKGGSDC